MKQRVICPECNGDYWKDPMRKCSYCSHGYITVDDDFPVEHPKLKSLSECASERDEKEAA